MKKVFFLLNDFEEFDFRELLKKHLGDVRVVIGDVFPVHPEVFNLIILWNYRKILQGVSGEKNVIVFHSSDLPNGKGWAPIYYTVAEKHSHYTVTGVLAGDEVDSGDIVVRARFKMKDNYIAPVLRKWDSEISIIMARMVLDRFGGNELAGMKQVGQGTYRPRRSPRDNEVDLNARLCDIVLHLRACESKHPAYFVYNQTKYIISITPEETPDFPDDLCIEFLG